MSSEVRYKLCICERDFTLGRAAQLAVGLSHDEDDVTHLEWAPVPDAVTSEDDESEYEEVKTPSDEVAKSDVMMVDTEDLDAEGEDDVHVPEQPDGLLKDSLSRRRPTPPLPLSPISNPSSPQPSRKRQRTEHWQPPEYIPDWLPPFPTAGEPLQAAPAPAANSDPALMPNGSVKTERPATPPLQAQVSTASSSADYHTVVPYDQSTLANVPTWHLPSPSERPPDDGPSSKSELLLPAGQQVLLEAYHHILTHPPPARVAPANPGRYRVALALIQQMEKNNRWDAPTTLYGSTAPNPLRVATMPPSYAMPISKGPGTPDGSGSSKDAGEKEEEKRNLPGAYTRHIAPPESITPMLSRPMSRIPGLAKDVLPVRMRVLSTGFLSGGSAAPVLTMVILTL